MKRACGQDGDPTEVSQSSQREVSQSSQGKAQGVGLIGLAETKSTPGYLIRRAHQLANAAFVVELRGTQITGVQFTTLMAILDEPNLSGVGVAERIRYDKMTTSRILRVLERRRLIERRVSPSDRRETLISCTVEGQRIATFVAEQLPTVTARVLAPLSAAEGQQLLTLLKKLETASRSRLRLRGDASTDTD